MRGFTLLLTALFGTAVGSTEFVFEDWEKSLSAAVKEKRDGRAAQHMETLLSHFADLEAKDQKSATKALEKCLGKRRDEHDDRLYLAVVRCFAAMGEPGQKAALRALKRPTVKDRTEVLAETLLAVSAHADPADVRTLERYLVHKEAGVVAASARSLAAYHALPERLRKELVGELVKNYSTIYSNSLGTPAGQRQPNQPVRRPDEERFQIVQAAFEEALRRLTPTQETGPTAWMRWYNKNRNRRWDPRD